MAKGRFDITSDPASARGHVAVEFYINGNGKKG